MNTTQILDKTKRRLGRGLSSLIGDPVAVPVQPPPVAPSPGQAAVTPRPTLSGTLADDDAGWRAMPTEIQRSARTGEIAHLRLSSIVPSPFQPRREMDPAGLERLADSIKRSGLMQPIVVRSLKSAAGEGAYELVAGERRWRAAAAAGLLHIPAVVRELSDEESAECALVENLQREDLNPMDRAFSLRMLCEKFGLTQEDVSERVGLDRSTVTNLIRLTELEPPLARLISSGDLSAGHGRALLAMPHGEARVALGGRAASEKWSVRRLEHAARGGARRRSSGGIAAPFDAREAARQRLEKRLAEHLGTKVTVATDRSGSRGRVTIEFYGLDHFDGILAKLGLSGSD